MIKSDDVETFLNDVLLRAEASLAANCNDRAVGAFAEDRVSRAEHALKKRSRYASRNESALEDDLHDVRKAGKKLRYLLEFFQPVIAHKHDRTIIRLTCVQNRLGQFNDIAASEALIRNASFTDVPPEVVQESLQWLEKQKCRRMRAASQRVRDLAQMSRKTR